MERKIRVLPTELTLKIAAGEVIERPASILKELLENALDAGATAIRIELWKGGCAGIRIEDNGKGIARDEAPLAFERFATSKIDDFDDLYGVTSYGFRGEALPSIAAIARVEMTTRTKDALSGTRIVIEAGQVVDISEIGCPAGTSITVSRVFDNVPVRKKFLKSEATEQGYCTDVVHCAALADAGVKFDVLAGGRNILSIPATIRADERVALILGKESVDKLIPLKSSKDDGLHLRGFISKPDWSRSSARHLYCFVNRRHVKDPLINHAVMTAYRNVLEPKRYPVAVLQLTIPAGEVDVNVHPAKMEVRFQNPRDIYGLVVESALHALSGISSEMPSRTTGQQPIPSGGGYQARVEEALRRYHLHTGTAKLSFKDRLPQKAVPPSLPISRPPEQPVLPALDTSVAGDVFPVSDGKITFSELAYLGQTDHTYLIFSGSEGLILVDQHAAHERILFNKLQEGVKDNGLIGQQLLMPEIMTLMPRDYDLISDYLDLFPAFGFEVDPFGDHTLAIKAVPALLPDLNPVALIQDIIDNAAGMEHSPQLHSRKDHLIAVMACRGAVKANHPLSEPEVIALCRDMDQTPYAATCPHGRPTYVSITRKDLEKMFKRR